NLAAEYANSDRDERHKFNFYMVGNLPWGFTGNVRMQAHSAQPITDNALGDGTGAPCSINNSLTRFVNGIDCGRNHLRKNNEYFSLDFGLARPFRIGERFDLTPRVELFNATNSANNVNPLTSPALFNFDGFLRKGVGDPLQAQLSIRLDF
ncbi:MAG TPA: TonB-dependent receptor, partial [Edaphobacter sp.]